MKKKNNIRDLIIGFLGWFIVGNLIFPLLFLLLYIGSDVWSVIGIYGFGILTIIAICFLFRKKRNWLAIGIIAAAITNAIAWKVYLIGTRMFVFVEVLTIPLPIGLSLLEKTVVGLYLR